VWKTFSTHYQQQALSPMLAEPDALQLLCERLRFSLVWVIAVEAYTPSVTHFVRQRQFCGF
jgi:hypothetical protein